jgi:hypothetical protein
MKDFTPDCWANKNILDQKAYIMPANATPMELMAKWNDHTNVTYYFWCWFLVMFIFSLVMTLTSLCNLGVTAMGAEANQA